jgi:thiol:disulfide interchange protein DsbD
MEPASDGGLLDPVKWQLAIEQESVGVYWLVLTARIDPGWYLYSQHIEPGGPEATAIELEPAEGLVVSGKAEERSDHQVDGFDEMFGMDVRKFKESVLFRQQVEVADPTRTIKGQVYYMSCDDARCLPGVAVPFEAVPATRSATMPAGGEGAAVTGQAALFAVDKSTAASCGESTEIQEGSGMWGIFVLGFLGGLLALLTPCVFPMIPLTVSFFTKGSQDKKKGIFNAASYGFYILLVYLLLSIPFHLLDSVSPGILNEISTNVWLNIAFFLIFLFFAFSFFGYYELTLPSSWTNKAAAAEGIGGAIGIFFMALTLALVSFSCTGPILGSLLAGALTAEGGAWQLTAGMGGFGLALALPFALFAAFPSWLSNLPKSGGWMTTVKVVLGFLELALALKFLSNADLVKHWGLLKIEIFLGLWIVVFLAMGLYLFGKILFPHDAPQAKLSAGRKLTGILAFAFAVYLMTGFRYDEAAGTFRPLKLLSGLAPPTGYSWLHPKECPQNLDCFKDFEQGLAYARSVNKPIMIDFTGHACVNCRKMEEHVWPEAAVYGFLKDDYVLISLYVDEKIELPVEEQQVLPMKSGGTFRLRTTGHKWQYMQTELFDNNSQPYYVLLSPEGRLLAQPVGYTPDVSAYAGFLQCGLDRFKALQAGE